MKYPLSTESVNIGLTEATDKFDASLGVRLSRKFPIFDECAATVAVFGLGDGARDCGRCYHGKCGLHLDKCCPIGGNTPQGDMAFERAVVVDGTQAVSQSTGILRQCRNLRWNLCGGEANDMFGTVASGEGVDLIDVQRKGGKT